MKECFCWGATVSSLHGGARGAPARSGGEDALADMMNRYRSAYGEAGQSLSDSAVMDEMAADFTQVLLEDADLFGRFAQENRTLAERLLDALKELIAKIRANFTGRAQDAAAQQATGRTMSELTEIAQQWQSVYDAAAMNYAQNGNTATREGDGVRYKYALKDKRVPTYEELIAKPDMVVVDISTPKTQGTFAERRKKIKETVPEVIKKPYLNRDTGTMIFLTKKSYTHAFNNNKELDINAAEHFPELIENAILTHAEPSTHGNENANGVYTFFAAARGKEDVPVKLKVKEIDVVGQEIPANVAAYFEKNPKEYAEAYDSVVLEVLEIEESPNGSGKDVNRNGSFLTPTGLRTIKVADFLPLVNGDESKYVPKSGNMAQLKSTAPLRQMMAQMPQQMMIQMPRLTTVEQDMAEAAQAAAVAPAAGNVEDTVRMPTLSLTDADVPGTEPLTAQDVAREMVWRGRMASEPAAPQVLGTVQMPQLSADIDEAGMYNMYKR